MSGAEEALPVETFLDGKVTLLPGDARARLAELAPASLDAVVTDPPYALVSIGKRFGKQGAKAPKSAGASGVYKRAAAGFMGQQWDTGETAFDTEFWRLVWHAMKPGAHLVAFSGTRSYHRLAVAIEDAGFEIRDQLAWLYGSGFPKSHDVSKAIDKALGAEREKVRVPAEQVRNPKATGAGRDGMEGATRPWIEQALERGYHEKDGDQPAAEEAQPWQGWGTALKPAWEPMVLARKPLKGTIAANVLQHGTGAINVAGCLVGNEAITTNGRGSQSGATPIVPQAEDFVGATRQGRWPPNIVHDGSDEVVGCFPETAPAKASAGRNGTDRGDVFSLERTADEVRGHDDAGGSAARFFYSAKADGDDRLGSKHPTVKPLDLMQWLVRLVCPRGGLVLDPFAGTGTTGEAAWREGCRAVLIEREAGYQEDIRRRMALALAPPRERKAAARKGRNKAANSSPEASLFDLLGPDIRDNAPED